MFEIFHSIKIFLRVSVKLFWVTNCLRTNQTDREKSSVWECQRAIHEHTSWSNSLTVGVEFLRASCMGWICMDIAESVASSKRLNSSKQPQAPHFTKPTRIRVRDCTSILCNTWLNFTFQSRNKGYTLQNKVDKWSWECVPQIWKLKVPLNHYQSSCA